MVTWQKIFHLCRTMNAAVGAIANVEIVIAVRDDCMRKGGIAPAGSLFAPRFTIAFCHTLRRRS